MTFFFYDLETSGINPRTGRIMQFAGQRTDDNFNPIGKPLVCLVRLTEEVLPDPEAILVHGITPQKTLEEGYSEPEFIKLFNEAALQPNTIILGFNSIRFDDEFMRYTFWRNFHDPYEWQWKDGRSRWDILDAARMTRALRPEGIEWPFDSSGKASNRLELLTKANKIAHEDAHDALADVQATIKIAKLLKTKQPKIFDFLLQNRGKQHVAKLLDVSDPKPVVHSSGMLSSQWQKTSVVIPIAPHPVNNGVVLVYDLRFDPRQFKDLSASDIKKLVFTPQKDLDKNGQQRLPVKGVYLNRAPAVAPLGVLDAAAQERIGLTIDEVQTNLKHLSSMKGFGQLVAAAWEDQKEFVSANDPDQQLYDGFVDDSDKPRMQQVRNRSAEQLNDYHPEFKDSRLSALLLRYKGRNFPAALTEKEQELWKSYVSTRLSGGVKYALGLEKFGKRLYLTTTRRKLTSEQEFLLSELELYGQSLIDY